MKKVLKAVWDGALTLAGYAVFTGVMSVVIIVTPIMCVITALKGEIKLSDAFGSYMRYFAKAFYEALNK